MKSGILALFLGVVPAFSFSAPTDEAAQIALAEARLLKIKDVEARIAFLENLVTDRDAASPWAMRRLCDRGALITTSVIKSNTAEGANDQYGAELRLCESRMRIVFVEPAGRKMLDKFGNWVARQKTTD